MQIHRVGVELEHAAQVGLDGLIARQVLAEQGVELAGQAGLLDVAGALGQRVDALAGILGVGRPRPPVLMPQPGFQPAGGSLPPVAEAVGVLSSCRGADQLEVLGGELALAGDG